MVKTHYDTGLGGVACGAETSWRKRVAAKEQLELKRTKEVALVTCANCKRAWSLGRA